MNLKRQLYLSASLCMIALMSLFFSHLALTDIAHGESGLTAEWNMVRVSFLLIATTQLAALFTFRRALLALTDRG